MSIPQLRMKTMAAREQCWPIKYPPDLLYILIPPPCSVQDCFWELGQVKIDFIRGSNTQKCSPYMCPKGFILLSYM